MNRIITILYISILISTINNTQLKSSASYGITQSISSVYHFTKDVTKDIIPGTRKVIDSAAKYIIDSAHANGVKPTSNEATTESIPIADVPILSKTNDDDNNQANVPYHIDSNILTTTTTQSKSTIPHQPKHHNDETKLNIEMKTKQNIEKPINPSHTDPPIQEPLINNNNNNNPSHSSQQLDNLQLQPEHNNISNTNDNIINNSTKPESLFISYMPSILIFLLTSICSLCLIKPIARTLSRSTPTPSPTTSIPKPPSSPPSVATQIPSQPSHPTQQIQPTNNNSINPSPSVTSSTPSLPPTNDTLLVPLTTSQSPSKSATLTTTLEQSTTTSLIIPQDKNDLIRHPIHHHNRQQLFSTTTIISVAIPIIAALFVIATFYDFYYFWHQQKDRHQLERLDLMYNPKSYCDSGLLIPSKLGKWDWFKSNFYDLSKDCQDYEIKLHYTEPSHTEIMIDYAGTLGSRLSSNIGHIGLSFFKTSSWREMMLLYFLIPTICASIGLLYAFSSICSSSETGCFSKQCPCFTCCCTSKNDSACGLCCFQLCQCCSLCCINCSDRLGNVGCFCPTRDQLEHQFADPYLINKSQQLLHTSQQSIPPHQLQHQPFTQLLQPPTNIQQYQSLTAYQQQLQHSHSSHTSNNSNINLPLSTYFNHTQHHPSNIQLSAALQQYCQSPPLSKSGIIHNQSLAATKASIAIQLEMINLEQQKLALVKQLVEIEQIETTQTETGSITYLNSSFGSQPSHHFDQFNSSFDSQHFNISQTSMNQDEMVTKPTTIAQSVQTESTILQSITTSETPQTIETTQTIDVGSNVAHSNQLESNDTVQSVPEPQNVQYFTTPENSSTNSI